MDEHKQNPADASRSSLVEELQRQVAAYHDLELNYQRLLKALQEKEEFNFALFQFNPEATVIVDREGKVIKSNIAKKKSGDRLPNIGDIMYRDYARGHSIDMYSILLSCITEGKNRTFTELRYKNKILSVTIAPFPNGAIITTRDITSQKQAEHDRIKLIEELRRTLDEVESLRQLLPICASCKKIRDDDGYWNEVEVYFEKHAALNFSHGVCPDCMKKLYPDIWEKISHTYTTQT